MKRAAAGLVVVAGAAMKRMLSALAFVLAAACGANPTAASASLSAGRWAGTTSQGAAITFEVSADEALTTITVGHRFNGCSGSQTFSNLNIPTTPNTICIPGPCPASSYRALHFSHRTSVSGPATTVDGVFLPGGRAQGQAEFRDYPGCGTATGVEWTATRR